MGNLVYWFRGQKVWEMDALSCFKLDVGSQWCLHAQFHDENCPENSSSPPNRFWGTNSMFIAWSSSAKGFLDRLSAANRRKLFGFDIWNVYFTLEEKTNIDVKTVIINKK